MISLWYGHRSLTNKIAKQLTASKGKCECWTIYLITYTLSHSSETSKLAKGWIKLFTFLYHSPRNSWKSVFISEKRNKAGLPPSLRGKLEILTQAGRHSSPLLLTKAGAKGTIIWWENLPSLGNWSKKRWPTTFQGRNGGGIMMPWKPVHIAHPQLGSARNSQTPQLWILICVYLYTFFHN